MAYLLYSPNATDTTKFTYAADYLDPFNKIILQDLHKRGWQVGKPTSSDPKWLGAMQDHDSHLHREEGDGEKTHSLQEHWREESARRTVVEGGKSRERKKLTKSPRSEMATSQRMSLSRVVGRKEPKKLVAHEGESQVGDDVLEETCMMSGASQERNSIAEIAQQKAQETEVVDTQHRPEPAKSLRNFEHDTPSIYKYGTGNEMSAAVNAQLDHELLGEIAEWVGIGGILKTIQVSVVSEEGICIDDKGERVCFPPKWDLPLFPWENQVSRSGSTKSKDSSAVGSLEYAPADYTRFFKTADRYQKKDEPDEETHSVE